MILIIQFIQNISKSVQLDIILLHAILLVVHIMLHTIWVHLLIISYIISHVHILELIMIMTMITVV